ncbi:PQQ-binding-like beta-propeller repeat protein [Nakamurella aerolata]|uniref:Uncharacterized protein n=1 Tax=Nakamurella aerolata TaxID=1656892 RepID=A0A849A0T1_9ACTN|nr:hypothetical protein [Nakamurella aerolata]NNG34195.1 hypothetical protein [Nakamurella aerolata]
MTDSASSEPTPESAPPDGPVLPRSTGPGSDYRRRRRRDWIVAGAIAVVAALVAGTIYLTSDIRATASDTAPDFDAVAPMTTAPTALRQLWSQPTDPATGAATSAYGTVVTTDQHSVVGRDVATGQQRWKYERSNKQLCAVASNDVSIPAYDKPFVTPSADANRGLGIFAAYQTNGMCQELILLDPKTGERRYQRTSPNQTGGSVFYGDQWMGWMGPSRTEVYRYDLFRTVQLGEQPSPDQPGGATTGCTFTDAAVSDKIVATIEHCADKGNTAQLVINYTDPSNISDNNKDLKLDYNVMKHSPLAEIDTKSAQARILAVESDSEPKPAAGRVAVVVSQPEPQVIIYDSDGSEVARSRLDIPAESFGPDTPGKATPRLTIGDTSYSLIGSSLVATGTESMQQTVQVNPTTTTSSPQTDAVADRLGVGASSSAPKSNTETYSRTTPTVSWALTDVIGLPGVTSAPDSRGVTAGSTLLVPTRGGLAVVPREQGTVERTIAVNRAGNPARVDVRVVGNNVVELRGSSVAVLGS